MKKMNIESFCQKIPLFKNLSQSQIKHIAQSLLIKNFAKNDTIFFEGDKATSCYIIFSGKVKIYKVSRQGKEQIIHIMQSPDVLAEVPMFAGENYPASCAALTESVLLSLSREKLIQLIKTEPQIALNMLALQAQRLREFTLQLESLSTQDTAERLMKYLSTKISNEGIIKLDLSLTALASLLGVSRENLSRTISKLVKEKIITYNGKQIQLLAKQKLK